MSAEGRTWTSHVVNWLPLVVLLVGAKLYESDAHGLLHGVGYACIVVGVAGMMWVWIWR